jgi:tetratricopeptide (TPR) repeat protein
MNLLGGHPLAMRAILPRLEKLSAGRVAGALRSNLASLRMEGNEDVAKLYATLGFVEQSLPTELQPLLVPIAMHEGHVSAGLLQLMARQVDPAWTRAMVDALMQALVSAGLLRDIGQATYEMHPVLTGYLRSKILAETPQPKRDSWTKAFVDVMGGLADSLSPLELHQQRIPSHLQSHNFHYAMGEAERLNMETHTAALIQSLAAFAQNTRNFAVATRLFERLANDSRSSGSAKIEASAYNQLGVIAREQRDFAAAEQWCRRSLAIEEKQGDERGAAGSCHELGTIAEKQFDFAAAEQWYRKSLSISERLGIEEGAAKTYHQLGRIAEEQLNYAAAEQWYRKSLAVKERLSDGHGAAHTYHQLGVIAHKQLDFAAAEQWCRKALAIKEKQGDEHGAASTYHLLGANAQKQHDFPAAEGWYLKSLAIEEKQRNEHGAAISYVQLGTLAGTQGDFLGAGRWLIKGMRAFLGVRDTHLASTAAKNFMFTYNNAPPTDQSKLKAMWEEAGLGEFPSQAA